MKRIKLSLKENLLLAPLVSMGVTFMSYNNLSSTRQIIGAAVFFVIVNLIFIITPILKNKEPMSIVTKMGILQVFIYCIISSLIHSGVLIPEYSIFRWVIVGMMTLAFIIFVIFSVNKKITQEEVNYSFLLCTSVIMCYLALGYIVK